MYQELGGSRQDQSIHALFLSSIPDQLYRSEQNQYNGSDIDTAIEYFKQIYDRQQTYQNPDRNLNRAKRAVIMKRKNHHMINNQIKSKHKRLLMNISSHQR